MALAPEDQRATRLVGPPKANAASLAAIMRLLAARDPAPRPPPPRLRPLAQVGEVNAGVMPLYPGINALAGVRRDFGHWDRLDGRGIPYGLVTEPQGPSYWPRWYFEQAMKFARAGHQKPSVAHRVPGSSAPLLTDRQLGA